MRSPEDIQVSDLMEVLSSVGGSNGAAFGRISAVKYGTDAYDQWSVDELLTLAKGVAAK